jgi:hypothetical protein
VEETKKRKKARSGKGGREKETKAGELGVEETKKLEGMTHKKESWSREWRRPKS